VAIDECAGRLVETDICGDDIMRLACLGLTEAYLGKFGIGK